MKHTLLVPKRIGRWYLHSDDVWCSLSAFFSDQKLRVNFNRPILGNALTIIVEETAADGPSPSANLAFNGMFITSRFKGKILDTSEIIGQKIELFQDLPLDDQSLVSSAVVNETSASCAVESHNNFYSPIHFVVALIKKFCIQNFGKKRWMVTMINVDGQALANKTPLYLPRNLFEIEIELIKSLNNLFFFKVYMMGKIMGTVSFSFYDE
jgi:hypothetical protein